MAFKIQTGFAKYFGDDRLVEYVVFEVLNGGNCLNLKYFFFRCEFPKQKSCGCESQTIKITSIFIEFIFITVCFASVFAIELFAFNFHKRNRCMHFVVWILFTIRLDWIGLNVYCKMIRSLISSDSDYCLNHQLIVYHFIKNTNFFVCADVSIHLLDKLLGRWAVSTLNPQTRITHLLLFLSFFFDFMFIFLFLKRKKEDSFTSFSACIGLQNLRYK